MNFKKIIELKNHKITYITKQSKNVNNLITDIDFDRLKNKFNITT